MADDVPMPSEWHPWYDNNCRSNRRLLDWLASDDPQPFHLTVMQAPKFSPASTAPQVGLQVLVLTKRRAYSGPKEYRDRLMNPGFIWNVATDQYGRSICSGSREAPL